MGRYRLRGNVLCTRLSSHAYLAFVRYPEVYTYIDGRVPQLFSEPFLQQWKTTLASPAPFDRLLDQRPIDHVVVHDTTSPVAASLARVLAARPDFALVHFDHRVMLWTRRARLAALAERPLAFRLVIPPLIDDEWFATALDPRWFPAVMVEIDELMRRQPMSVIGYSLVASLIRHPVASKEQQETLKRSLPHLPDVLPMPR